LFLVKLIGNMKNINFKKYQLNKLQHIKQTYKYIYIFRYHDITIFENISIKKQLKKLNYSSFILKQNLLKNIFLNIKGQGSILLIYGNNENFLFFSKIQNILKKIELISIINNQNIYSNIKISQNINTYKPFNISIINPFLFFLYYLRKIKMAYIT
jgi:ribosomal protein L10